MRPFPSMLPLALACLASLALACPLASCGLFGPSAPAGVVTGTVLFNGQPAPGKRVELAGQAESRVTDAQGRYTFTGVKPGRSYFVSFLGGREAFANEVASWKTPEFTLGAGEGRALPAFDVAYNDLLYPDREMALLVGPQAPVPFHWSTHPQASRYRLVIRSSAAGQAWGTPWSADPTGVFAQTVPPGAYDWKVQIDAGDAGTGESGDRKVNLSAPPEGV